MRVINRFFQYVAAFAVSALSSNWERLGKPFNPLLGETYELERDDFRYLFLPALGMHIYERGLLFVLQSGLRAGVAPPASVCVPCGQSPLHVPRLHLPEAQVLGQRCRHPAQRDGHGRASQVKTGLFCFFFYINQTLYAYHFLNFCYSNLRGYIARYRWYYSHI
jgi:Oxysterol-binding protein